MANDSNVPDSDVVARHEFNDLKAELEYVNQQLQDAKREALRPKDRYDIAGIIVDSVGILPVLMENVSVVDANYECVGPLNGKSCRILLKLKGIRGFDKYVAVNVYDDDYIQKFGRKADPPFDGPNRSRFADD